MSEPCCLPLCRHDYSHSWRSSAACFFKAPIDLVERIDRACISFSCTNSCTKSSLIRQLLHHGLNQLPQISTPVEQIETFAAVEE